MQTERRIECRNNVSIPARRTQLLPAGSRPGKEGNKIGKLGNKPGCCERNANPAARLPIFFFPALTVSICFRASGGAMGDLQGGYTW